MTISTNRKILAAGALILVAAFIMSLSPMYRAYCAYDHRWTCAKVRKNIELECNAGMRDTGTTVYERLEQVLAGKYEADEYELITTSSALPAEDGSAEGLIIVGLCKEGGSYHVHERADGSIEVLCDADGHDVDYREYIN